VVDPLFYNKGEYLEETPLIPYPFHVIKICHNVKGLLYHPINELQVYLYKPEYIGKEHKYLKDAIMNLKQNCRQYQFK
jgi:hypothetical protein